MSKKIFNIKDNKGNTIPMELKDKLVCGFAGGRRVIMGESVEGTFAIELKNPEDSTRYPYQGVRLTEGSLMAFYATMSVYFQNKGINVQELLAKYLPDDSGSVPCFFERYDNNEKED